MTNTIRETAYKSLDRIANIEDHSARKAALRKLLADNHNLAIFIQRCYHPNYNFSLPSGNLPESIAKKSNHDDYGMFYRNMKRWEIFRLPEEVPLNGQIKKHVVEQQFIDLYEAVSSDDADLLIAVKDKKLPWDTLSCEFVVDAVPELFPESFRPSFKNQDVDQQTNTNIHGAVASIDNTETKKSKRQIAKEIMQSNRGLARKDYIRLFETVGISKVTAGQYYQQLKDDV